MRITDLARGTENSNIEDLRRMVGSDKHRPGPAYGRLVKEQVPVWAIIGYVKAIMEATGSLSITEDVVGRVAVDYDIHPEAVLAALLYYEEHRNAIDALLEENAATIT